MTNQFKIGDYVYYTGVSDPYLCQVNQVLEEGIDVVSFTDKKPCLLHVNHYVKAEPLTRKQVELLKKGDKLVAIKSDVGTKKNTVVPFNNYRSDGLTCFVRVCERDFGFDSSIFIPLYKQEPIVQSSEEDFSYENTTVGSWPAFGFQHDISVKADGDIPYFGSETVVESYLDSHILRKIFIDPTKETKTERTPKMTQRNLIDTVIKHEKTAATEGALLEAGEIVLERAEKLLCENIPQLATLKGNPLLQIVVGNLIELGVSYAGNQNNYIEDVAEAVNIIAHKNAFGKLNIGGLIDGLFDGITDKKGNSM